MRVLCRAYRADNRRKMSPFQAAGLTVHIFYHDIIYLTQPGAVFQHLPRLVRVEMNLNKFVISHSQQAISLEILDEVIMDGIFIQPVSFNEKLCIIAEF